MFTQGIPSQLAKGVNPYPGHPVILLPGRSEGLKKANVTLNKEALELLKIGNLRDRLRFAWDGGKKVLLIAGSEEDESIKTFKLPERKKEGSLRVYNKELYGSLKACFNIKDSDSMILFIEEEPLKVGEFYEDPTNIPSWMQDRTWYVVKKSNLTA